MALVINTFLIDHTIKYQLTHFCILQFYLLYRRIYIVNYLEQNIRKNKRMKRLVLLVLLICWSKLARIDYLFL